MDRYWARIRRQLEANTATQKTLDGMLSEFRVTERLPIVEVLYDAASG